MAEEGRERIYVGGLDPSRGLTVELVAKRLRSVEGVDILSINDSSKNMMRDEDGDLVDTRNFFYLEARAATASAAASAAAAPSPAPSPAPAPAPAEDAPPSTPTKAAAPSPSALDLIAKQYQGVKWKGCQLRVEAAKPHILQRLEEERAVRVAKQESITNPKVVEESDEQSKEEEKVVKKDRRRLRIRKRFGEEAFNVDTRPHSLELSLRATVWGEFSFLHKRAKNKRESQQKKLMEKRKKERRLWASGKGKGGGSGKEDPIFAESDDLNSLMFLNRGIHIRFHDAAVGRDDGGKEVSDPAVVAEPVEVYGSDMSSSVPSSDSSDSEQSFEHQVKTHGESKGYVWSDDEDEDDDDDDDEDEDEVAEDKRPTADDQGKVSSEESVAATDQNSKNEGHYVSSEEDNDAKDGTSDDQSTSSEDIEQKFQDRGKNNGRGFKKLMDGTEYTKAAAVDEFSGGMDFGDAPGNFGDHDWYSEDYDSELISDAALDNGLVDDISSNMGVLSSLFPNSHFDKQPLVDSFIGGAGDEDGADGKGLDEARKRQSSSLFGGGMIMQRYDPTKEDDKKFEVPSADKQTVDGEEPPQGEDGKDAEDIEDKSAGDVESSEISGKEKDNETLAPEPATSVEGNDVPTKDVYEQGKLEDVFKQARDGKTESFSLANMFESKEETQELNKEEVAEESDVYEQDKLEDVFKKSREDESKKAASGGFTFGFQSQAQDSNAGVSEGGASFSFGFNVSEPEEKKDQSKPQEILEVKLSNNDEVEPEAVQPAITTNATNEEPKSVTSQRKRRAGMTFPESDLDKWEEMFFSMNEGAQILKDFSGMKKDEENQERWQKERLVLTADWKRKQKSSSSKRGKKVRR